MYVTMNPQAKLPRIAPNDTIAPIHDLSSIESGPVFNGVSSDSSKGVAIDTQPVAQPNPIIIKLAAIDAKYCLFVDDFVVTVSAIFQFLFGKHSFIVQKIKRIENGKSTIEEIWTEIMRKFGVNCRWTTHRIVMFLLIRLILNSIANPFNFRGRNLKKSNQNSDNTVHNLNDGLQLCVAQWIRLRFIGFQSCLPKDYMHTLHVYNFFPNHNTVLTVYLQNKWYKNQHASLTLRECREFHCVQRHNNIANIAIDRRQFEQLNTESAGIFTNK